VKVPRVLKKYYPWLLIFLGSLVQISYLARVNFSGRLWMPVESKFPLDPGVFLGKIFYFWEEKGLGGESLSFGKVFYALPLYFLTAVLNMPVNYVQTILYFLYFFLATGGYFLFLKRFTKSRAAALVTCFFYTCNYYFLSVKLGKPIILFSYIFAPWVSYMFLRFLENPTFRRSVFFSLSAVFLWPALSANPAECLPAFTICAILLVHEVWAHPERRQRLARALPKLLVVFLVANAFYLLPYLATLYYFRPSGLAGLGFLSSNSTLGNLLRLVGDWAAAGNFRGDPYKPYFQTFYSNPVVACLNYVPFLLAFLAPLFLPVGKKLKTFLWTTALFLFISKGPNPPLGFLFVWFYRSVPLFWVFRSPYSKFFSVVIFSLGVVLTLVVKSLFKKRGLTRLIVSGSAVLIYLSFSLPLFTGSLFEIGGSYLKSNIFPLEETQNWRDLSDYVNNQPGSFRVFSAPVNRFYLAPYTWNYYGTSISYYFLRKPEVVSLFGGGYRRGGEILEELTYLRRKDLRNPESNFISNLGRFGVRYIINRGDFDLNFREIDVAEDSSAILSQQLRAHGGLELRGEFGPLELYEVGDFASHVYAGRDVGFYDGSDEALRAAFDLTDELAAVFIPYGGGGGSEGEGAGDLFLHAVRTRSFLNRSQSQLGALVWPETSVRPESFLFPLVRLKEKVVVLSKRKPLEKADVLFWLGLKRLAEGNEISYRDNFRATFEILKSVPEEGRDETFWKLIKKILEYSTAVETRLSSGEEVEIERLHDNFRVWVENAAHVEYRGYHFRVEIPRDGYYRMWVDGRTIPLSEITGAVGEDLVFSPSAPKNGWGGIGAGTLEAGGYNFGLQVAAQENLMAGVIWSDPAPLSELQPLLSPFLSEDAQGTYYFYDVPALQKGKSYQISFDYRARKGEQIGLAVGGFPRSVLSLQEFISYGDDAESWGYFETEFDAGLRTESGRVYIYSFSEDGGRRPQFRNIVLREVFKPEVALVGKGNSSIGEGVPEIDFVKINPTRYEVSVTGAKNPYYLVFNEGYSRGWRLLSSRGGAQIGEQRMANGFANSWLVEPSGESQQFILEFWPQKLFWWGLVISGGLVLLTGFFWATTKIEGPKLLPRSNSNFES